MKKSEKIGQEQFHSFVFNEEISWQEIIYDLINTEQLDPWDINLSILAQKYIEKVKELEEANFILSSKVLLICSLLLRIKSEILLNKYVKDIDDILFKRKEDIEEKYKFEEIYDEYIPELLPKTPLPRFKKISLQELIKALSEAIKTENRRILRKNLESEAQERVRLLIPKKTINIIQRIRDVHEKVNKLFEKNDKIKFSEFAGPKKEDKIDIFIPLLHLDNHNKLWLQQENHFDEIWIHKSGEAFIIKDNFEETEEE